MIRDQPINGENENLWDTNLLIFIILYELYQYNNINLKY